MKRIFKRKLYDRLQKWKDTRNGKTAILVEGARRVGKSTLVEQFAKNEYVSYIIIDFNKASKRVMSLFDDLMDIDFFFLQLQAIYNVNLIVRNSVIIFDEVQACPKARQAIKYLVADGRYDYIETGSLISITKNTKDITIPSEEERTTLQPMDYEEFRWAIGDTVSVPLLKQFFDKRMMLSQAHRTKMRELRLYMLVGGMPQAVNEYLETNNLSMVDLVKRDIIRLYLDDFQKIDPSRRIEQLYMNIPAQLNQNSNRYKPYSVVGSVETDKLQGLLREMEDSKTVLFAYHANDPNINAHAESLNSKLKGFRAELRGVQDLPFFMFRASIIFG